MIGVIKQDGIVVVNFETEDTELFFPEFFHYLEQYRQDGPVEIMIKGQLGQTCPN